MPVCPACSATLDQDFGMVTCGECQAVLMININGDVVMGGEVEQEPAIENPWQAPVDEDSTSTESAWDSEEQDVMGWQPESLEDAPVYEPIPEVQGENEHFPLEADSYQDLNAHGDPADQQGSFVAADEFFSVGGVDTEQGNLTNDQAVEGVLEEENAGEFDGDGDISSYGETKSEEVLYEGVAEDEKIEHFTMPTQPDPLPVDVTSFANSEESNLEGGDLLYDITIEGLDSKELRETFQAVVMDPKLKLNDVGLVRSIRAGRVLIENLNPVKAKRIAEQLQFFDLKVRWKQKRVVMEPDSLPIDEVGDGVDYVN